MGTDPAHRRPTQSPPRTLLAWLLCLACAPGCGGSRPTAPEHASHPFVAADDRPVCVVLSVGGARGLAHLGALRELQRADLEVECVVGNSMGALVGGLYAAAPDADPVARYQAFAAAYLERTREEARGRGLLAFLLGTAAVLATGGAAAPALAVGVASGTVGASTTAQRDLERTVTTLDTLLDGVEIDALPLRYTTFHHAQDGKGVALRQVSGGNLAAAIGKSIANPLLFPGFDPVGSGYVDPGSDRVSAVPVQDACARYPDARLLVLNVTAETAFYHHDLPCPVLEVSIDAGEIADGALLGQDAGFERAVAAGASALRRTLRGVGIPLRAPSGPALTRADR